MKVGSWRAGWADFRRSAARLSRVRLPFLGRIDAPDPRFELWHDAAYRLPLTSIEARAHVDPRRAELALAWLQHEGVRGQVRRPESVPWSEVLLAHDPGWLDQLVRPEELARIFAVETWDVDVDAVLGAVRIIVGGTIGAARSVVHTGGRALNLAGGFHHARRAGGGGFCALNDVAIAVACLRRDGFSGRVVVLDLDAHPPDGTADILGADAGVWIGSISGSHWGAVPGVDEVLLPVGTGDDGYLLALGALLARLPKADLAFVLAGGDVLAGDALGQLGLTLPGAAARDLAVLERLGATPSVWLPGGGYGADAWRVLAGTGLVLAFGAVVPVPPDANPLRTRFAHIARGIRPEQLGEIDLGDVEVDLGLRRAHDGRLLGFYSAQGVELALQAYGVLSVLERLGYGAFRVEIRADDLGDRFRLLAARPAGGEHLLVESVLGRAPVGGKVVLYVHWLTLRHPLGAFRQGRAPLPGQEVPGLGLAREAGELLLRMAQRLGLAGVGLRPAHFHVAWATRHRCRFVDAGHQALFEAMLRDFDGVDPGDVSRAFARGEVRRNDVAWPWDPSVMVEWLEGPGPPVPPDPNSHFTLASSPAAGAP